MSRSPNTDAINTPGHNGERSGQPNSSEPVCAHVQSSHLEADRGHRLGATEYFTNSHQKCSESNQIEVSQNAGDDASPLSCSPECPQEEYVYDYAYADSASKGNFDRNRSNILKDLW